MDDQRHNAEHYFDTLHEHANMSLSYLFYFIYSKKYRISTVNSFQRLLTWKNLIGEKKRKAIGS